jgi:DNA-binding transcriptional LysR family regulator
MTVKVEGNMVCNDGEVLHDWAVSGKGLAWRSMWEVGAEIESGQLITVLMSTQRREMIFMRYLRNDAICPYGSEHSSIF